MPWPLAWMTDSFLLLVVLLRDAMVAALTVSKTHPSGSVLGVKVLLMMLVESIQRFGSDLQSLFIKSRMRRPSSSSLPLLLPLDQLLQSFHLACRPNKLML